MVNRNGRNNGHSNGAGNGLAPVNGNGNVHKPDAAIVSEHDPASSAGSCSALGRALARRH